MRRRTPLNLILIAAAAMLTALLWLDRERETPPEPLTALSRAAITSVRVVYPAAPDLVLARTGEGWRLTSPVAARAEDGEVTRLLRLAEAEVRRRYPADEIDPAETGLDEPLYTVVFTGEDGGETRVALGDRSPLADERYARVGDTVYLLREPDTRVLDTDYSDLVARELLAGNAEITGIDLPDAAITRAETGGWRVRPESADRGADAAQKTVDAWRRARAPWLTESEPGAGSGESETRVRLHLADGTVKELAVTARKPRLILRDPALGVDYHVAADEAGPLLDMAHGD